MKLLVLFITVISGLSASAQPGDELLEQNLESYLATNRMFQMISPFMLVDSIGNDRLDSTQAIYHFNFQNLTELDSNAIVRYSVDSTEYWCPLNQGSFSVYTSAGYHSFMMYINDNYFEVFSPMLPISGGSELTYDIHLQRSFIEISDPPVEVITFKPVIYLYPEVQTKIDVKLNIHDGKHPFFYPEYSDSWSCIANPNGTLEMNGTDYRYLFWEAEQVDHLSQIEVNEGFVVTGSEAISFLEEKLTEVGFTSVERADFITFWGPKLAANENNLVRFEWNETCDKFADLNISPQPDHMYRFYIFMSAIDTDISIQPQSLPTFNREGFVALEWGGQISIYQPNTEL